MLDSSPQEASSQSSLANLVLAIGAQGAPSGHVQTKIEKECLTLAQTVAFSGMLENPSLGMIKVFLLLAFYMLGACRRNAAFMYLGVAVRAAHALGLHNPETCNMLSENTRKEQEVLLFPIQTSVIILNLKFPCMEEPRHPRPHCGLYSGRTTASLMIDQCATNFLTDPAVHR